MENTLEKINSHTNQQIAETILQASNYSSNFQPMYPNTDEVVSVFQTLNKIEGVTTPRNIDNLQRQLALIALNKSVRPIVITGSCAEPILDSEGSVNELVDRSIKGLSIVNESRLSNPLHIRRERGQNTKPRSQEHEVMSDGRLTPSYMGDAINSRDPKDRSPNPQRLMLAGIQALQVEKSLSESMGRHIPAAHEALSILYETAFMRIDPATGKRYLLSADLPWIGARTNHPESDHVKLLSGIENPVGVKLDHTTTPELIKDLSRSLNPDNTPGKLVLMLRLGLENTDNLPELLKSAKADAPGSLVMYDIHGSTKKLEDGTKTRSVVDIVAEIDLLSRACQQQRMKLHGIHLETTTDNSRFECIDDHTQVPTHPGAIDPQLNPRQTLEIINKTANILIS